MKGYSRLMRSKKDNVVVAFMKKETVLCAAAALAVISMFAVPPDQEYGTYLDYRVLALLFCLMLVIAGLQSIGLFRYLGLGLLKKNQKYLAAWLCPGGLMLLLQYAHHKRRGLNHLRALCRYGTDHGKGAGASHPHSGLADCSRQSGQYAHPYRQSPEPVSLHCL